MYKRKQPKRIVQWADNKIESVRKMALLGMSEEAMADVLEVSVSTFNVWKKNHKAFKYALEDSKLDAGLKVLDAFLLCCIGYPYEEEVATYDRLSHQWVKTTVKRFRPPDVWAQAKYLSLKHRNEGWSETQRIEINHNISTSVELKGMSTEFLAALEKESLKHKTIDIESEIVEDMPQLPQDAGDDT